MGSAEIQLPKDCVETSGLISSWALELSTVPSPIPGATTSLSFLDVVSSISLKMQLEATFPGREMKQDESLLWTRMGPLFSTPRDHWRHHSLVHLAPRRRFSEVHTCLHNDPNTWDYSHPYFLCLLVNWWFFTLYLQLTFLSPTSAVWSQVSEFSVCINNTDFLTPGTESKNSRIATQGTYLQCRSWLVTPGNKKILAYHTRLSFLGG